MKTKRSLFVIAAVAILFTGCTSIKYQAGYSYVGFTSDDVKSVQQSKKTSYDNEELLKTYDDEFVYDEEGNILEQKQTKYFDDANKFDEYVITYQKIGGVVLPKSAAINGVVYLEVEYDLLPVDHEGSIDEYTSTPVFYRNIRNYLTFESTFDKWTMDLGVFDVPFMVDGKYVRTEEDFNIYKGLDRDRVLTIGYNNILLQRFYYSWEKFNEGYALTMDTGFSFLSSLYETKHKDTTFLFTWDVKADQIIQKEIEVVESLEKLTMNFKVEREFDDAARLTSEQWTVTDSKKQKKGKDPVVLFEEKLTY